MDTTKKDGDGLQDEAIATVMQALDYLCFMMDNDPVQLHRTFDYVVWRQKRQRFLTKMPLVTVGAA